jgi:hypothetical protein
MAATLFTIGNPRRNSDISPPRHDALSIGNYRDYRQKVAHCLTDIHVPARMLAITGGGFKEDDILSSMLIFDVGKDVLGVLPAGVSVPARGISVSADVFRAFVEHRPTEYPVATASSPYVLVMPESAETTTTTFDLTPLPSDMKIVVVARATAASTIVVSWSILKLVTRDTPQIYLLGYIVRDGALRVATYGIPDISIAPGILGWLNIPPHESVTSGLVCIGVVTWGPEGGICISVDPVVSSHGPRAIYLVGVSRLVVLRAPSFRTPGPCYAAELDYNRICLEALREQ